MTRIVLGAIALAALAVAAFEVRRIAAGLELTMPPVQRPCPGCGYPQGQGHNDRCPLVPDDSEVVGMPTTWSAEQDNATTIGPRRVVHGLPTF